eukprot:gene14844-20898_t
MAAVRGPQRMRLYGFDIHPVPPVLALLHPTPPLNALQYGFDIHPTPPPPSEGLCRRIRNIQGADGRLFALKQVKLEGLSRVEREETIDEARVLAQLNHPHVTKHYDSWIDQDNMLNIVMELAAKGNLSDVIKDSKGNIKIGDLGIARALSDDSNFARTIVGTPYYLSPELCEEKPYNEKSDLWAMGVVLYECAMGHRPFDAQNEGALIRKILRGQYAPVKGQYTPALLTPRKPPMYARSLRRAPLTGASTNSPREELRTKRGAESPALQRPDQEKGTKGPRDDEIRDVMQGGGPNTPSRNQQYRVRPEEMPAAGGRNKLK